MCDVCKAQKSKKSINASKNVERKIQLSGNRSLKLDLCYVHDVEIFVLGEKRFFKKYPKFTIWAKKKIKNDAISEGDLLDFSE